MDIDGIARGASDDAGGLDVGLLGDFLPRVVSAAESGHPLRRRDLDRYGERGAAAAQAGVPLRALIDLYLSACWRLWAELPVALEGTADQVRAAGLAVLKAADDGVAALAEGYQLARADLVRRQDAERREVFEELLAGGRRAEQVVSRAADLGLDLSGPHAVLVAAQVTALEGSAAMAVLGRVERALAGRLGDAQPLLLAQQGQLICVFAAPDRAAVEHVTSQVSQVLQAESGSGWQLAVGRALHGPGGVRVSHEQAQDDLAMATRIGLTDPVVRSGDVAVYRVLLRDRAAIVELISTTLGPLAAVRGADVLLETLETYYATGGTATEAARRLHLSVRAVTYRLARIQAAIGRDPTAPEQRFVLHAAVLGARLLGWPDTPLDSG